MERQTYWRDDKLKYYTAPEIEGRIGDLAKLYVPQWSFDPKDPDIGGTIAKIFAKQMEGNLNRYYQVLDKYHEEFVNMMGITLTPAKPAYSGVNIQLAEDTIPGLQLYKGTKFLAQTEDEPIVFETRHNLYVTNSRLVTAFMTEEKTGKIVPILGDIQPAAYLPQEQEAAWQEKEEEGRNNAFPFPLFFSEKKGIEQNVLLIYHSCAFDIENDAIYLRLEGNEKLIRLIEEGKIQLTYYTKEGLVQVEELLVLEDRVTLQIKKQKETEKITLEDGREYGLLVLLATEPIKNNYEISRIGVSSKGSAVPMEAVSNGSSDLNQNDFEIFGDTLTLFQECYVGHNRYFGKAGAKIRIKFQTSYLENRMTTIQLTEEDNLKVIKRKPKNTLVEVFAEVMPEEISLEYFNGIGWKKLDGAAVYRGLFAAKTEGEYEISFICPSDWQETQVGSYQGKCIRIQLQKATNCYLRPAIHYYPRIRNMTVSYDYEDDFMEPEILRSVAGTQKLDLTPFMKAANPFCAFYAGKYEKDSLYLGLDQEIESGPVSLFFKLEKEYPFSYVSFKYEYSTIKGFKQMKVVDYTKGLSCSGIVLFMPPSDMKKIELEGKTAFWIRITPIYDKGEYHKNYRPIIQDIRLNVAQVANIETREEEEYFLEEIIPNIQIPLGVENILDLELWVNEMGQHSGYQMQQMEKEFPDKVRAEYDSMGEIRSFFVKWEESTSLEHEKEPRSFCLDRLKGMLHFGDGIHTYLPKVVEDVSFKVRIRCCQGRKGNVEVGAITESMENLMFVDFITNPIGGYGGSDMETVEKAMKRGSNLLRNRKRMVSVKDYTEEIMNYSDRIDKVKCITGINSFGEQEERALNFVLLLKEYYTGSSAFRSIAEGVRNKLLENSEITVLKTDLHMIEPVFVEVSVDVWVETVKEDRGFEIQNLLQETLERFLNPVSNELSAGWEIGVIPGKNQIAMQLTAVKREAVIKKMVVTAAYVDHTGYHEVDLEELKVTPFMVCCNGTHRVHVMYL